MTDSISEYLSAIGRKGGQSRSPAKLRAIRKNAQRAGRPVGSKDRGPRKSKSFKDLQLEKIVDNNA